MTNTFARNKKSRLTTNQVDRRSHNEQGSTVLEDELDALNRFKNILLALVDLIDKGANEHQANSESYVNREMITAKDVPLTLDSFGDTLMALANLVNNSFTSFITDEDSKWPKL